MSLALVEPDSPQIIETINQLEVEITSLAAHINAATCRFVDLLGEFDLREGYLYYGCRSTADWLSWRCGIAVGAAREKVRVGLALRELPLVHAAFASGELSYSKVRAITRVATAENEDELLGLAYDSTGAQMDRMAMAIRRFGGNDAQAKSTCYFDWFTDVDGSVTFSGRLAPEDAAVVVAALQKAGDRLRKDHQESQKNSAEIFSHEERITQADAFTYMAKCSLETETVKNDHYQVVLQVTADELSLEDGMATTDNGFALDGETARRLSCDASVITQIHDSDGEILTVGRKTRVIPTAIRRALKSRDKCCRFPGCSATRFVDRHHIKHWARGGETKLSNLVTLCRRHHKIIHDQRIHVGEDGKEFVFTLRTGEVLQNSYCQKGSVVAVTDHRVSFGVQDKLTGSGDHLTPFALGVVVDYFRDANDRNN